VLFVWIPANAGSWHDQKNEGEINKTTVWREKKTLYHRKILGNERACTGETAI
jgi:hypothetical protein